MTPSSSVCSTRSGLHATLRLVTDTAIKTRCSPPSMIGHNGSRRSSRHLRAAYGTLPGRSIRQETDRVCSESARGRVRPVIRFDGQIDTRRRRLACDDLFAVLTRGVDQYRQACGSESAEVSVEVRESTLSAQVTKMASATGPAVARPWVKKSDRATKARRRLRSHELGTGGTRITWRVP